MPRCDAQVCWGDAQLDALKAQCEAKELARLKENAEAAHRLKEKAKEAFEAEQLMLVQTRAEFKAAMRRKSPQELLAEEEIIRCDILAQKEKCEVASLKHASAMAKVSAMLKCKYPHGFLAIEEDENRSNQQWEEDQRKIFAVIEAHKRALLAIVEEALVDAMIASDDANAT